MRGGPCLKATQLSLSWILPRLTGKPALGRVSQELGDLRVGLDDLLGGGGTDQVHKKSEGNGPHLTATQLSH